MTLFTDWIQTDSRYFWLRGAMWGFAVATLLWNGLIPWLRTRRLKSRILRTLRDERRIGSVTTGSTASVNFTVDGVAVDWERFVMSGGAGGGGITAVMEASTDETIPIACNGCTHYYGKVYNSTPLICAMHPYGVEEAVCPDFED